MFSFIRNLIRNSKNKLPDFRKYTKIPRFSRECIITEKIDGTNAQILITEDNKVYAGSRKRWITPGKQTDNYGFAQWVKTYEKELLKLGPGRHFGEWFGKGINRNYRLQDKYFVLFNVHFWNSLEDKPNCVGVVPVIIEGIMSSELIGTAIDKLECKGSYLVPGFMNPEGIVIHHCASNRLFKKTIVGDDSPKKKGV